MQGVPDRGYRVSENSIRRKVVRALVHIPEIEYDWLGNRPKYIVLPGEQSQLTLDNLPLVFFVLYEMTEEEDTKDHG